MLIRASYLSLLGAIRSNPQDAWTAFNAVWEVRQTQFDALLKEWSRLLDIAVWLHHQPENRSSNGLCSYLEDVQKNSLGDSDLTTECLTLANKAINEYHPGNVAEFNYGTSNRSKAFEQVKFDLSKVSLDLVEYKRALRFFDSIHRITQFPAQCDCCKMVFTRASQFVVLSSCGHLLCTATCSLALGGDCPTPRCSDHYQNHQMIPGQRLVGDLVEKGYSDKGEKLRQVVDLVRQIPETDQVLVFVQSSLLHQKVVEAFKESGISVSDLKTTASLSTTLTAFQKMKGKKMIKVLVLNIGDASASGRLVYNSSVLE